MAKTPRSRTTHSRRSGGKSSVLEKSLRDAQTVISGYIESGGKRVKDAMNSLVEILENQHLAEALSAGSQRLTRAVSGSRATAKRRTPNRKPAVAKRAASARGSATRRSPRRK
jgi:hypothetical protein